MKTTIENLIKEQIIKETDYIREHNQIRAILEPLAGKPIDGTTLSKKRLSVFDVDNGYTLNFVREFGMFYIKGKYTHLIGYANHPFIEIYKNCNSNGFSYFDSCHGSAAEERIKQLQNLDVNKLSAVFGQIKVNFDNLCTLFGDVERQHLGSFNNPVYYNILRAIKPDESVSYDKIKLSDFYFIRK